MLTTFTPLIYRYLALVLPRGWLPLPLEIFSLSPQNQKESDLSHPGDQPDILCDHFDGEKKQKTGGTLPGARVSRHKPVGRGGGCYLRKFKIAIVKSNCFYGLETYCEC